MSYQLRRFSKVPLLYLTWPVSIPCKQRTLINNLSKWQCSSILFFFLATFKKSLIELQFIYLKRYHLKYTIQLFLVYAQFCNYHYNLIFKHFHHPQRNFVFACRHSHFLHSPLSHPLHALIPPITSPRKPPIYLLFGSTYLPILDISYI